MARRLHNSLKLLEMFSAGFVVRYERTNKRRKLRYDQIDIAWQTMDRKQLHSALEWLKLSGLTTTVKEGNSRERIKITNRGRARLLDHHLKTQAIRKPKRWDKKWRLVMYDIPENRKSVRDTLRKRLKDMGFLEFQKSTFVHPYPCYDEVNFVINYYSIEDHVYCVDATIKPDRKLRAMFKV
jgi:DNA-binding transcriptional regulator PaaX